MKFVERPHDIMVVVSDMLVASTTLEQTHKFL